MQTAGTLDVELDFSREVRKLTDQAGERGRRRGGQKHNRYNKTKRTVKKGVEGKHEGGGRRRRKGGGTQEEDIGVSGREWSERKKSKSGPKEDNPALNAAKRKDSDNQLK